MVEKDHKTLSMTEEEKEELIKAMRDNTMKKLDEMQQLHKNQVLGAAQELHIIYEAYQKAGFTKKESMELLKFVITAGITVK